uniref:Myopalladin n=1 Tax=Homo sapiens TaxID=9606 RepID=A0A8I5KV65_HUMAN
MLTVQVKTSSAIELPDSLAFLWIIPMCCPAMESLCSVFSCPIRWNVSQAHGLYSSK